MKPTNRRERGDALAFAGAETGSIGLRAWHAVRVLSGPPRSHAFAEISRWWPNGPDLAAFIACVPVSAETIFGHEADFSLAVSGPGIPVPGGQISPGNTWWLPTQKPAASALPANRFCTTKTYSSHSRRRLMDGKDLIRS